MAYEYVGYLTSLTYYDDAGTSHAVTLPKVPDIPQLTDSPYHSEYIWIDGLASAPVGSVDDAEFLNKNLSKNSAHTITIAKTADSDTSRSYSITRNSSNYFIISIDLRQGTEWTFKGVCGVVFHNTTNDSYVASLYYACTCKYGNTYQARYYGFLRTSTDLNDWNNLFMPDLETPPIGDSDDTDTGSPSGGGGGGGSGNVGGDTIEDDGLPDISAVSSGLMTVYQPSILQLQSLGSFLWSDSFDLNSFKKLFNDPFDSIFGLSIIPVTPATTGNRSVYFGNIDTGVSMPVVSSQWYSIDMGTVSLNEIYGSAMDYDPNTQVSIYLPFIGMRNLNTVDVMASTIHLIYKFDVLTGSCVAQLYVNHSARSNSAGDFSSWTKNQGFLYSFEGQCAVNIPLSGQDFTNTIRSAIGAVGMTASALTSMATGHAALGVAALAMGTANLGIQSNTSIVERSGHLSGSQALLDQTTPALIVIRPHRAKPSKYYALRGLPSQTYAKLSDCSGYTMIAEGQDIKASGATDSELEEITRLLEGGVYL